jgi:hypothetical protein
MADLTDFNDPKLKPGMRNLLPDGLYFAEAVKLEFVPIKRDPKGRMLVVQFEILDGESRGRRVFDRMTLTYPSNAAAELFAKARLKTFAWAAIGHDASDTDELLYCPVSIVIGTKNDEKYGPGNTIRDYRVVSPDALRRIRSRMVPGDDEVAGASGSADAANESAPTDALAGTPQAGADMARLRAMQEATRRSAMRTSTQVGPPPSAPPGEGGTVEGKP